MVWNSNIQEVTPRLLELGRNLTLSILAQMEQVRSPLASTQMSMEWLLNRNGVWKMEIFFEVAGTLKTTTMTKA